MVSHQLQHLAGVADRPVCDQEEKPWVALVHWLSHDPLEWRQDVGATHVSPHPLNVITGHGQALLLDRDTGRVDSSQGHRVV